MLQQTLCETLLHPSLCHSGVYAVTLLDLPGNKYQTKAGSWMRCHVSLFWKPMWGNKKTTSQQFCILDTPVICVHMICTHTDIGIAYTCSTITPQEATNKTTLNEDHKKFRQPGVIILRAVGSSVAASSSLELCLATGFQASSAKSVSGFLASRTSTESAPFWAGGWVGAVYWALWGSLRKPGIKAEKTKPRYL